MIQIDDAGSGSLLGGTIIGVLRTETGEFTYEIIPLKFYRNQNFENKAYIQYVIPIVKKMLKKLRVNKNEGIEICRGYMFDALALWLEDHGYHFIKTEIKDPLQTKIEKTFEEYTIDLGLPKSFITYTKYPFHFHRILKWVYADHPKRHLLCKTGWKSWKKYGNLEVQHNRELIRKNDLMCLKCYKNIPQDTEGIAITYTSNKLTKVFVHNSCI
ncbi:hypothetical protein SAMN05446037_1001220 [Anaerovirgula multivorans]|uniref:Uncharacterized protein n=1 Tax=Anaerovirgula multivorans TaxID=312168 RepID=A0A238ZYH0_9FIRM|nr:hypothetical protein [Anaerovirgula multivorans]SNR88437.1 hypothetical protein SAMN05446037_1001220 [Anaerovirgula multivorans]